MRTLCGSVLILIAVFYERLGVSTAGVLLLLAVGLGLLWEDR